MISGKLWIPRRRWFCFGGFGLFGLASKVELEDGQRFKVKYRGLRPKMEVVDEAGAAMASTSPLSRSMSFFDAEGDEIEGIQLVRKLRAGSILDLKCADETAPLVLKLVDGRREFGTSSMSFWHGDFQPHINFRAEDRLVFCAMMVAFYAFGGAPTQ